MTVINRTDATDEEFRARFERFGIFDEERVVEVVARAMCESDGEVWVGDRGPFCSDSRANAVAAIAAYRATDGDLRTRMADVADNLDYYAGKTGGGTYAGGLQDAAGQIRDALAQQAGDGAR